jgi:hypothetical protein
MARYALPGTKGAPEGAPHGSWFCGCFGAGARLFGIALRLLAIAVRDDVGTIGRFADGAFRLTDSLVDDALGAIRDLTHDLLLSA